ncbi:hypothetical protein OROHE_005567 [Orobanche hederae]
MLKPVNHHATIPPTPLLSSSPSSSEISSTDTEESPANSFRYDFQQNLNFKTSVSFSLPYKSLAILKGHAGSVSCLALCGEFILSASQGKDIIVWQNPDFKIFTRFGHGDGSVKALITFGNKVFTAHQDSKIRVWKVSRSSENVFRLVDTLPTTKDYLGKFMKQSNYVRIRRHHRVLWIEHADSISCLSVSNGLLYSGSWDKTLKIWRISDFKCLESIEAHDDAINGLATGNRLVYTASADGKIKAWGKESKNKITTHSLKGILEGHKDVSMNCVVVSEEEDISVVYGGGSDGYVMGWLGGKDSDSWRLTCEARAHEMSVLCMCVMGEFLCSGSADRSIRVWKREINGGLGRHMVIEGHEGPVKCLEASPARVGGGFVVYSGSLDKSLRVWWVPHHYSHDGYGSLVAIREKKIGSL